MPPDMFAELAVAAGTAVVQAAGKDGWDEFRHAVARWFGRGDAKRERAALERLDRTAADLGEARQRELGRVRTDQVVSWQIRFKDLMEDLEEPERSTIARELRALLGGYGTLGGITVHIGGDQNVTADHGSIAIGTNQGPVSITNPTPPDPA